MTTIESTFHRNANKRTSCNPALRVGILRLCKGKNAKCQSSIVNVNVKAYMFTKKEELIELILIY